MNSFRKKPFAAILNSLDEKYHNFDGGNGLLYDYAEGQPESNVKLYQADPYQIIVQNNDAARALKAVLFGRDKFLLVNNFGSDPGIAITMGQPGVSYVEMLHESAAGFTTQFMRIESTNQLQVTKFITVNKKKANGNFFQRSMNMQQHKSTYQQDKNMLDAPIHEIVNGSTYWEIEIEPGARVFYTIFPLYAVDTSDTLTGNDPIKTFAQAQVNTSGMPLIGQQAALPLKRAV